MHKLFKITFGIMGAVILMGVALILSMFLRSAKSTENKSLEDGKMNISSVEAGEEAYFQAHHEYSSDLKAIGFAPEEELRYQIYLTEDSLPAAVKGKLAATEKPFVSKEDYRILGVDLEQHRFIIKDKKSSDFIVR